MDEGRQLKRLRPAPQGRGHRIRKRSNHVTLILTTKVERWAAKLPPSRLLRPKTTEANAEAKPKTTRRSSAKKSTETKAEATA